MCETCYSITFQMVRIALPKFQHFNLLKPTGYVMHQQFKLFKANWLRDAPAVQHSTIVGSAHNSIYVFCIYLRTNSELCYLQHKLFVFYKRDE